MNPSGGFIKPINKIIGEDGQTEYLPNGYDSFIELVNKVRATNPSHPLVYVYTNNDKQTVENYYDIKLETDDEMKLGIRFCNLGDIKFEEDK